MFKKRWIFSSNTLIDKSKDVTITRASDSKKTTSGSSGYKRCYLISSQFEQHFFVAFSNESALPLPQPVHVTLQ